MDELASLLPAIQGLHEAIRDAVVAACEGQSSERLATVERDEAGDTIYAIDKVSESMLVERLEAVAQEAPLILLAEGLPAAGLVLPRGAEPAAARWRVLVDPIDGTRGLMYQKRPAWVLTGVAPNRGERTRLSDVGLAVQTEIPLIKQHLSDQLWALRGCGAAGQRFNRISGEVQPIRPRPSQAETLEHGCGMISRLFPGARDVLAAIDEAVVREVIGPPEPGKAPCFEDQYASTGGQLHELLAGHDRFIADLRPLLAPTLRERGEPAGLCCHPYDLASMLIAQELGVVLTDATGRPLDAPLDLEADVAWVGYANPTLRRRIEPALQRALSERGLLRGWMDAARE